MRTLTRLVVVCAVVAAWSTSAREASAASVQRVQSGTAVNSANGVQTIAISSVDPAKSFLIFETRSDSNRPVGSLLRGRLASATTIEFVRVTDSVAPEPVPIGIQWYVVTFGSGVNVQRGEVTQSSTAVNVTISAVASLSQAFVLWSKTPAAGDATWSQDDPVVGELTTTTNLQFRTDGAASSHTIAWQVVEFTNTADINVQKGSITTMTGTTTSVTATLSPAVDVSKTFVLVGYRTAGTGSDVGSRMLRARLTNSTTITIDRNISGSPDDITEIVWQAVELKDGSIVVGGTSSLGGGVSTATVPLNATMNTARAVAFGSVQSGGGQNMGISPYAGDDIIGVGTFATSLGIAFRSAASATAGSGVLTLTVNKPAGTAEFDVMVASIAFRPNTAVITPPSGWTLARRTDNANSTASSLAVYWKAAEASEPTSYDWTFNTSTGSAGGILSFVNVDTANPVDVENGQNTANGLSHGAPSVTTTRGDEMIVTAHAFASSATWTPPAGMTEAVDVASQTVPNCCGIALEVNYLLQSAAGATGVLTATASNDSDVGNAQTLALRPANPVKYLTLTRDNTADTADIGWFVVQFDQGPGFKVGTFTKSTGGAPASQVISHGLGSVPKAIILWTTGKTNETMSGGYLFGYGISDGTTSKSVAAASLGAAGTSNASTRMANKALTIVQWGEVLIAEADLQSWDDTNFTLNWTTNNGTAYVIHYIVIGGPDVSAKVVEWTMGTGTGNRSVTGVGFQPNAVLHAHGTHSFTSSLPSSISNAGFGLGAMDADGDQWAVTLLAVDASGTSNTQRGQQIDSALYTFNSSLSVQKKASWVSMDADGFTVNFTNASSSSSGRVVSLALKGVNVKPGSFLKSTGAAPASQTLSGVGFQPSVVLLTSFQDLTQAAPMDHSRMGIGASDGTTEASSAMTDTNGQDTTVVNAIDKTSKVFMKVDSDATVEAEANLTSLNSDGFTLNWTTNDAVQTQILYLALAPTSLTEVRLLSLTAARYDRGVLVQWRTGYEIDNLGFHVYREISGVRTRVTGTPVGGSGLTLSRGVAATGEQHYAFWDLEAAASDPSALYWLEDLDFNGQTTWHGPVSPIAGGVQMPPVVTSNALGDGTCREQAPGPVVSVPCTSGETSGPFPNPAGGSTGDFVRPRPQDPLQAQWDLAGGEAVRIGIMRPGWYRIGQPDLVAAGLSPTVDPRALRLFTDGVEQALHVIGQADGRLDATDGIEFFASGVDTPYTDTRVYWLVPGRRPGRRLAVSSVPAGTPYGAATFWHSLQHKERSIYFAALRNGDAENWFGQLVSVWGPSEATVRLSNIDVSRPVDIELALQGVTVATGAVTDHRVGVIVNGREVAEVAFNAQERPVFRLSLPPDVLQEGDNLISLVARGGESDYSLVDFINVSFWHTHRADADQLLFTAEGQQSIAIGGFSTASIRVMDITDPSAIIEVVGTVRAEDGLYSVALLVPGTGERRLFAFTEFTVAQSALVYPNRSSSWHAAANAFDYLVLARREYFTALHPLVEFREQQGYRAAVVDIQDVYDEFSFGEKTPAAIRRFLHRATATWQRTPRFLVLAGDSTMDPRNYGGFGDFDLIPTKLLSMASVALETASDEWFADFNDDGLPEVAVGRLPVRSVEQAEAMVRKIVGYETQPIGSWTSDVTFVADENDASNDFEASSRALAPLLPNDYRPHELLRGRTGSGAGSELAAQVTEGRLLVNYLGHGSTRLWGRHGDLLSNDVVRSGWRGGSRLPFVVAMNCLNGFFHGIYDEESLAEALLRTPDGGAIATWASSGLTSSATQQLVSRELFRLLFQDGTLTLGEAAARAKRVVRQRDVRRSWIFFGDPATRLLGVRPGPEAGSVPDDSSIITTDATLDPSSTDPTVANGGDIATGAVRRVRLADFDGDGRADLLVYRPVTGEWQTWTAMGRLLDAGYWPLGLDVQAVLFNGDRLADLFLYDPLSGGWFQLVNTGEGFITTAGTTQPDAEVQVGDLNGDGRDEVLLYQRASGSWSVGAEDGQGRFAFSTGNWTPHLTMRVADFDGDGRADILAYHRESGALRLIVSGATSVDASLVGTTYRDQEPLVANLDGDRRADLLFYDRASGHWEAWVGAAAGGFAVAATGTWPVGLATQLVDLTGDRLDEVLLYEARTGAWTVAPLTTGAAGLSATGVAPAWASLASGDIDGDGFTEVYLYSAQTGLVQLLKPEPVGALQLMSATWPTAWTLYGYAGGEPLEVASTFEPLSVRPSATIPARAEEAVDAEVARAAIQALGLQMKPAQTRSVSPGRAAEHHGATRVGTSLERSQGGRTPVASSGGSRSAARTERDAPAVRQAQAGAVVDARTSARDVSRETPPSGAVSDNALPISSVPQPAARLRRASTPPARRRPTPSDREETSEEPAVRESVPAPEGLSVLTDQATSVTVESATLHGSVGRSTSARSIGFLWGIENPPTTPVAGEGASDGSYTQMLTGLSSDTVYYFRLLAEEPGGGYLLGEVKSFRTSARALEAPVSDTIAPDAEEGDRNRSTTAAVPSLRNTSGATNDAASDGPSGGSVGPRGSARE